MTTTVIKSIGPGKDYSDLPSFINYASQQDLVALDQVLVGEMYIDSLGELNYSQIKAKYATRKNCLIIRPGPGMGVADLDSSYDYGTKGIQISFTQGATTSLFFGVILEGLRISIPNVSWGAGKALQAAGYTNLKNVKDGKPIIRNCRMLIQAQSGNLIDGNICLEKNLVIVDSASTSASAILDQDAFVYLSGNTFISRNGNPNGYRVMQINYSPYASRDRALVVDNVFVGFSTLFAALGYDLPFVNNFIDIPEFTKAGFTSVTTGLIESVNDARPLANGPLIKAATSFQAGIVDVNKVSTGYTPDVGAIQRSVAAGVAPSRTTPFPDSLLMSDPITKKLAVIFAANSLPPRNILGYYGGADTRNGGSINLVTTGGPHYAISGNTNVNFDTGYENNTIASEEFSVLVTATVPFDNNKHNLFGQSSWGSAINFTANEGAAQATVKGSLSLRVGGVTLTADNIVDGSKNVYGVSFDWNTATGKIYRNGIAFPTTVTGSLTDGTDSNRTRYCFAYGYDDGSNMLNGDLYSGIVSTIALNDAEMLKMSNIMLAGPDITRPTMVGDLTATNVTMTEATINWSAAIDNFEVTGYQISFDNGKSYQDVGNVTSYTKTGLTHTTKYLIKVMAYDAAGNTSMPLALTITTAMPPDVNAPILSGILNLSLVGTNRVQMSWPAATDDRGITGYEYSIDGGTVYTQVGKALAYTILNLPYNTVIPIKLRAYDAAGNKSEILSNTIATLSQDTTLPSFAGTLTASAVKSSRFTLTWASASDNVGIDHYEYSIDGGANFIKVGLVTTYIVGNLTENTLYHVQVRAVDTSDNTSLPLTVDVTTPIRTDFTAPTFSGSIVAASVTDTSITITWPAATDDVATAGYRVSINGGLIMLDVGKVLTYTFTNLTPLTAYAIRVDAYDDADNYSTKLRSTVTTKEIPDTTAPDSSGATLSYTALTPTEFTLVWTAATDDRGVTDYEYSIDGGGSYASVGGNVLTKKITGLTPDTNYVTRVRAVDAYGNKSLPLMLTVRTNPKGLYSIGAGSQYNFQTLADFANFINGVSPAGNETMYIGEVYTDQSMHGVWFVPGAHNNDYYVKLRPAQGLSVNDLEKGEFDYGTTGIEITGGRGQARFGPGMEVSGFRIKVVDDPSQSGSAFNLGGVSWDNANAGREPRIIGCRIKTSASTTSIFEFGQYAIRARVSSCLFIQETNYNYMFGFGADGIFDGCTFVRRNGTGANPIAGRVENFVTTGCLFINCGPELGPANTGNNHGGNGNVSDSVFTVGSPVGFTYAAPGTLVVNSTNDFRPVSRGILIGAASQAMEITLDILGNNRGPAPDVGAYQLTPFSPLVSAILTSSIIVDGQTIRFNGTTTNEPTSGAVMLKPDTVANGAQLYGPFPLTLDSGVFSVTVNDIPAGNYTLPEFSFANDGGPSTIPMGTKIEIVGVLTSASDTSAVMNLYGSPSLPTQ